MSEQPDKGAVERAKEFLGPSSKDASIEDLLDLLLTLKKSCHPDRFTDLDAKKVGEERFKAAQQLIDELNSLRERQVVKAVIGNDLPSQRSELDTLTLRLQLNAAEAEILQQESATAHWKSQFASLQKEISAERAARRDREFAEIRKLYEPNKNRLVGAAIAILLTGSLAVLSQLEKVAAQLERIWPGAPGTMRVVLFILALTILVATLLRWLRHIEFQAMLGHVCTTDFARRFLRDKDLYFRERRSATRFDEAQVVDFLEKDFTRKNEVSALKIELLPKVVGRFLARAWCLMIHPKVVYRGVLGLLDHETYHHLKDAFIYWLIQRQLIAAPKAIRLVHEFEAIGEDEADD